MSYLAKLDESTRWSKKAEQLKRDIQKRREVLQTTTQSETEKKKMSAKTSNIDIKMNATESAVFRQITYFELEKRKAEEKIDREISSIEAEYEKTIRNAEEKRQKEKQKIKEKSESYIEYCDRQLESLKMKEMTIKQTLEQKKAILESKPEMDEDADKVLVRLKTELKQAEDQETECRTKYYELRDKVYEQKRKEAEEQFAMEKAKEEQREAMEKEEAMKEINRQKAIEKAKEAQKQEESERAALVGGIDNEREERLRYMEEGKLARKKRLLEKQNLQSIQENEEDVIEEPPKRSSSQGRFVNDVVPTLVTNTKRIIRRV